MEIMKICHEGRYKVKMKTLPSLLSWLRGTDCPEGSTHHLELTKGIKDDDGWLLALRLSSVYLCRTRCFLGSTRLIPDPKCKRIIEQSHRMWEVKKKTKDVTAVICRVQIFHVTCLDPIENKWLRWEADYHDSNLCPSMMHNVHNMVPVFRICLPFAFMPRAAEPVGRWQWDIITTCFAS